MLETHGREQFAHAVLRRGARLAVERERQSHVARDGQVRQHVEGLEDETHARAAQAGACILVELREVAFLEQDLP